MIHLNKITYVYCRNIPYNITNDFFLALHWSHMSEPENELNDHPACSVSEVEPITSYKIALTDFLQGGD